MKFLPDIVFATHGNRELQLDLLLPDAPSPLVVVIHGGGWKKGSRKDEGLEWLAEEGFAVARIEYRLSHEAAFPAQLDDCKAAVDWLRTHAGKFGWPDSPPLVAGTSAGGTLALLLAAEGWVRAAVAYCAPCDFPLRSRSQPHLTEQPGGTVHDLLGGPVTDNPEMARMASPSCRVTSSCAPTLLIHGRADLQVLPDQPASFLQAGLQASADVAFLTVPGAPHCGPDYHQPWVREFVLAFLCHHAAGETLAVPRP